VRALAPFRRRGCTHLFQLRRAGTRASPFMMGGTDVLGFPMTPSSENSQKFIETIDEPGLIVEIHSDVNRDG
jgi:hypothetical protein